MERFLTNVQRKALHDLLVQAGIDPNVIRWSNSGMGWTNGGCETLHAGICFFVIAPDSNGEYSICFRPSWDGGSNRGEIDQVWKKVIEIFEFWTHKVKEELDQPDPWGTFALAGLGTTPNHEQDNAPFTHAEAEHVSNSIEEFVGYLKREVPEYSTVEEHFAPQFERLAKQAKAGTGRIDWKNQFVGLLMNVVVAASLAPDQASRIWLFWRHLVGKLLLS